MKTLLLAVNSQYIHSNIAVWQLKANCSDDCGKVIVKEFNINQQQKWCFAKIVDESPDVVAFSCYIWNIQFVLKLANDVKSALPNVKIVFGGPEVSFDYMELMEANSFIDFVIVGEGETTLPKLISAIKRDDSKPIIGVCRQDEIKKTEYVTEKEFYNFPSPYTEEMLQFTKGKIIYFEGSRGCPFSCSYCLSQISHGVREMPVEQIKSTLLFLQESGVSLLKFVDRTFNANRRRADQIWQFAKDNLPNMKLHFEIGADLLDDTNLSVLKGMPVDSIQLEAGVQSTNPKTLATVCRSTNLKRLKENSYKILSFKNIHYHLDLIAGLPFEGLESFKNSFNEVYALHPHQLQLGFLKMLRGSKIRNEKNLYGYVFRNSPPYEIISNDYISSREIIMLTKIEEVVERYYNSSRFILSLSFLEKRFENTFQMFSDIADYMCKVNILDTSVSADTHFTSLLNFANTILAYNEAVFFKELLRCDWALCGFRGNAPEALVDKDNYFTKEFADNFYKNNLFTQYDLVKPENKKAMMKWYGFFSFSANPFTDINTEPTKIIVDYNQKDSLLTRFNYKKVL